MSEPQRPQPRPDSEAHRRIWADTEVGIPRVCSPEETAELNAILEEEERQEALKKAAGQPPPGE